ncbi:Nn.00g016960.m01.CDS01 [Neocucurbitaria sp. VM-36]
MANQGDYHPNDLGTCQKSSVARKPGNSLSDDWSHRPVREVTTDTFVVQPMAGQGDLRPARWRVHEKLETKLCPVMETSDNWSRNHIREITSETFEASIIAKQGHVHPHDWSNSRSFDTGTPSFKADSSLTDSRAGSGAEMSPCPRKANFPDFLSDDYGLAEDDEGGSAEIWGKTYWKSGFG